MIHRPISMAHFGAPPPKNSCEFSTAFQPKKAHHSTSKIYATPERACFGPGSARFNRPKGAQMLSKCANPECSSKFRYLHDGKVFRVEPDVLTQSSKQLHAELTSVVPARMLIASKPSNRPEYFWLCSVCSEHSTVGTDSRGVVLVPLHRPSHAAPAALTAVKAAAA